MELLTTSEMAKKWDISRRRITTLCTQGRIEGARFKGIHGLFQKMLKSQMIQDESVKMDRISSRFSLGVLLRKSMGGFVLWQLI